MDTIVLGVTFDTVCIDEPFIEARREGVSYAWSTGQVTRQILVPAAGPYVAFITDSAGNVIVDRHEVTVIVVPDPVLPIPDREGPYCEGEEITFSVSLSGYDSIQWNDGRGTVFPGFGPDNSMVTIPFSVGQGISYIAYYDRCGVRLTVLPPLLFGEEDAAPSFTGELLPDALNDICPGQLVDLSFVGSGFERLTWENGSMNPIRTISADPNEDYFLVVYPFCETDSIVFRPELSYADTSARIRVLPEGEVCVGDELMLQVGGDNVTAIRWEDGTTEPERIVFSDSMIRYSATVEVDCGVSRQIFADLIYDEDCQPSDCEAAIPELITPNGDGTNDFFRLFTWCDVSDYSLKIFNRWGQVVYVSDDASQGWDGTKNGLAQSMDTYLYVMQFRLAEGELEQRDGQFALVR